MTSVTHVPESIMKRPQCVIDEQSPPEIELPLRQLDPRVSHEPFDIVHQQRLQNLSDVAQETQWPVREGYPLELSGLVEQR